MGGSAVAGAESLLNASGVPTFAHPDAAARAFCLMAQYSSNLRALYETPVLLSGSPKEIRRERVETVLREVREAGRTLLTEAEAKEILSIYRIKEIDVNRLLPYPRARGAIALDARMILFEPDWPAASRSKLVIRPYPAQYVRSWKLADGTAVTIRPIRPEDEPLMIAFHKSLSEETVHLRYFGFLKTETLITHERLVRICFSDYDREIALVTERIQPGRDQQQIIAVARLIKAHGANEAEVDIVISDAWQGKGLGNKLLGDLVAIGRTEGMERIVCLILPENEIMEHRRGKLGCALRYGPS